MVVRLEKIPAPSRAKSARILQVIMSQRAGALKNVEVYKWPQFQKQVARRLLTEDILALRMAIKALKS